jgi:RHS repeat-associated protein
VPVYTWGADDPTTTGASDNEDDLIPRGFTGHEMMDDLGLIHMNGRIYDPRLARFLSADQVIQAPFILQSYNRYSYCFNNPLGLVDPSGYDGTPPDWLIRQQAAYATPPSPEPPDPFQGKPEYKATYDYLSASGGRARLVTFDEISSRSESIVDPSAPTTLSIQEVTLSDSILGTLGTAVLATNVLNLGGSLRPDDQSMSSLNASDPPLKAESHEVKRNFVEAHDSFKRTCGAETRVQTSRTSGTDVQSLSVQNPKGAAAAGGLTSAAETASQGVIGLNHALEVSSRTIGLCYNRSYVGPFALDRASGQIVVSDKTDGEAIVRFASNNGLPPLKFENDQLSIIKEDK